MTNWQEKVFFVTGGTSGIGKAIALELAEKGAKVVTIGRRPAPFWDAYDNVLHLTADLQNKEDILKAAQTIREIYGRLDGVCNVAGINDLFYTVLNTDDAFWEKIIDVNLNVPFRVIRAMLPLMIESGGGSIVNVGSYAALRGNHGPSYTAAKAGLNGLTRSVAFEQGKNNIRCNAVNPGGVRTNIGETSGGNFQPEMKNFLGILQNMPLRTLGEPDEVAPMCVFLLSDEARWINGAAISVDGGMAVC